MSILSKRPSPAMIVACMALLVALGGTSYATVLNVPRNSVGTLELKRNAVKAAKIAPNAVRAGHVLDGSLLVADFKAGQIPQGPKGDKGDTGAPGLGGYEVVSSTNSVTNAFFNFHTVSCPAGKRALGGGSAYSVANAAEGPFVILSQPTTGGTGWTVHTARSPISSWTMTVYAVCATVS